MQLFTLDGKGVLAALVLGFSIFLLGSYAGPYFVFVLLLFLILSALVTGMGKKIKAEIGDYDRPRGWKNVVANGIVAFAVALAFFINLHVHFASSLLLIVAYTASMSAVTADKFASEIGILDGTPVMLLNLKKVRKGTSGAMTALGTLSSFAGALLLALSLLLVYFSVAYLLLIAISGFLGAVADTVLGYFEEKGIGNKYTSNIGCAIVGTVLAVLLAVYL
ncbi:MAG: DUF92 domain-containing protein [Candidatus Micrarchaeia archaeon]